MAKRGRMKRVEIRRGILPDVQRLAGLVGADNLTSYVNDVLVDAIEIDSRAKEDNRECCKYDERNTGQDCATYWGPENVPDWCSSCLCFYELVAIPRATTADDGRDEKKREPAGDLPSAFPLHGGPEPVYGPGQGPGTFGENEGPDEEEGQGLEDVIEELAP